jgi:hypothetical protein
VCIKKIAAVIDRRYSKLNRYRIESSDHRAIADFDRRLRLAMDESLFGQ